MPTWDDWLRRRRASTGIDTARGLRLNVADHALDAASEGDGRGARLQAGRLARHRARAGSSSPFGPELPLPGRAYHFVCAKGQEKRPTIKAFRDWLFAEIEDTFARLGCDAPGAAKAEAASTAIELAHAGKRQAAPRRRRAKEETT